MSRQAILLIVLGALAAVAAWWIFLFSPGQERIAAVEGEIVAAEGEAASLQGRVARLEAVRAAAPETEAAIANLRGIVPTDPALAGALRQLEASAEDAGLEIEAVATTRPMRIDETSDLHAIGLTITARGSFFQIVDYLRRLEDPTITARGVVVSVVSIAPAEYPMLTVALTGQLFAELPPVPDPSIIAVPVPEDGADAAVDDAGAPVEDTGAPADEEVAP